MPKITCLYKEKWSLFTISKHDHRNIVVRMTVECHQLHHNKEEFYIMIQFRKFTNGTSVKEVKQNTLTVYTYCITKVTKNVFPIIIFPLSYLFHNYIHKSSTTTIIVLPNQTIEVPFMSANIK